jgi:hypothetical protein
MSERLNPGDWIEVRSRDEILGTLDADGRLEGMIFMPEMLQFCGRRFRVEKSAHKTCDYTTPQPFVSRRIERTVLLETRCDGSAHGGCQAGCTLLWKEAWLKKADGGAPPSEATAKRVQLRQDSGVRCAESVLWERAQVTDPADGLPRYFCQATEIQKASEPLAWWDLRQYIRDYSSGNVTLRQLVSGLVYSTFYHLSQAGVGLGPAMRWFYNTFHWVWRGPKFPRNPGLIPEGAPTPAASLDLQPGQTVRVKAHDEILKTITTLNRNRGMFWDAELVPYCGGTYKVLKRVNRTISERTGKMVEMKTACVVLDNVVCQARYSSCRMFCPRAMYPYWREIWLERVD